jgi:hypothetical protein
VAMLTHKEDGHYRERHDSSSLLDGFVRPPQSCLRLDNRGLLLFQSQESLELSHVVSSSGGSLSGRILCKKNG